MITRHRDSRRSLRAGLIHGIHPHSIDWPRCRDHKPDLSFNPGKNFTFDCRFVRTLLAFFRVVRIVYRCVIAVGAQPPRGSGPGAAEAVTLSPKWTGSLLLHDRASPTHVHSTPWRSLERDPRRQARPRRRDARGGPVRRRHGGRGHGAQPRAPARRAAVFRGGLSLLPRGEEGFDQWLWRGSLAARSWYFTANSRTPPVSSWPVWAR